LPPPDIASRWPAILALAADTRIERIFTAAYDPVYFDKTLSGRLNAPDGSFGVLYAAETLRGASPVRSGLAISYSESGKASHSHGFVQRDTDAYRSSESQDSQHEPLRL
jgi:hypothetical protein